MKISILGTGTSTGIPMLGCSCEVCQSTKSENKRLRTSFLIHFSKGNLLVDAGPDLRHQFLTKDINQVDHLIITHEHADHTHGIDELRPLSFKTQHNIPVTCETTCANSLKKRFSYIFAADRETSSQGGGIPQLSLEPGISSDNSFEFIHKRILGEDFLFFLLPHGKKVKTLGFLVNGFCYIPDCHEIPEELIEKLKRHSLKYLLIASLQFLPHDTHLCHPQTVKYIQELNPKKAGLIHLSHKTEHYELLNFLKSEKIKNKIPQEISVEVLSDFMEFSV